MAAVMQIMMAIIKQSMLMAMIQCTIAIMQSHNAEYDAHANASSSSRHGHSDCSSQDGHSDISNDGGAKDCDDNWMKEYLSAYDWGVRYVNSPAGKFWCGVPENGAATRVLRLSHPVCVVQKIRATRGNRVSEYTVGPAGWASREVASCKSRVEEPTLGQTQQLPASNCLIVDGALVVSCKPHLLLGSTSSARSMLPVAVHHHYLLLIEQAMALLK